MTHSPTPWTINPFNMIVGIDHNEIWLRHDKEFIITAVNSYDQHCEEIEYQAGIIQQLVVEKKEHTALIKQLVEALQNTSNFGEASRAALLAAKDAGFRI